MNAQSNPQHLRCALLWGAAGLAVLIATLCALLLPVGGQEYQRGMILPRLMVVAAGFVVLWRFPPKPFFPLVGVLAAQAAFLTGRISHTFWPEHMELAHFFYLSAYAPLVWATYWLSVTWLREKRAIVLLDTAIVCLAMLAVTTDALIIPAVHDALAPDLSSAQLASKVSTIGYLHLATLVAGLGLRMALTRGGSNSRVMWLFAGTCAQLLGELSWQLPVTYPTMRLIADWCYLSSCIGFIFAVGLPMRYRTSPQRLTTTHPAPVNRLYRESYVLTFGLVVPAVYLAIVETTLEDQRFIIARVLSVAVAVLVALRLRSLIRESQRAAQGLLRDATHDPLTKCLNRAGWTASLEYSHQNRRNNAQVLIILDLDHFKQFNDQYGHLAGDALLQKVVTVWEQRLPSHGVLARLGGEEFGVVLPHDLKHTPAEIAEKLISELPQGVTCSAGVASLDENTVLRSALNAADIALYRAKDNGRNRAEVAHADDYLTVIDVAQQDRQKPIVPPQPRSFTDQVP